MERDKIGMRLNMYSVAHNFRLASWGHIDSHLYAKASTRPGPGHTVHVTTGGKPARQTHLENEEMVGFLVRLLVCINK